MLDMERVNLSGLDKWSAAGNPMSILPMSSLPSSGLPMSDPADSVTMYLRNVIEDPEDDRSSGLWKSGSIMVPVEEPLEKTVCRWVDPGRMSRGVESSKNTLSELPREPMLPLLLLNCSKKACLLPDAISFRILVS